MSHLKEKVSHFKHRERYGLLTALVFLLLLLSALNSKSLASVSILKEGQVETETRPFLSSQKRVRNCPITEYRIFLKTQWHRIGTVYSISLPPIGSRMKISEFTAKSDAGATWDSNVRMKTRLNMITLRKCSWSTFHHSGSCSSIGSKQLKASRPVWLGLPQLRLESRFLVRSD